MRQSDFYRGVERAAAVLATTDATTPARRAAAVHDAMAPLLLSTAAAAAHACRIGCAHCCHLPVGVTFGEALRLAAALRDQPDVARRVTNAAQGTAAIAWGDLAGLPCPLLSGAACTVHEARPLPCRSLASSDAGSCARGLAGTGHVALDEESYWIGLGAADALAGFEASRGTRELRSAVCAVLTAGADGAAAAFAAARTAGD